MMKKPHKKASVKGMTLIECLVALCVFSVCATVMVQVSTSLNQVIKNAMTTQEKLCIQSPRAQAQLTDSAVVTQNVLALDDAATAADKEHGNITFSVQFVDSAGNKTGKFDTIVYADTYKAGNTTTDPDKMKDGAQLNYMKFDLKKVAGAGGEVKK